MKLFSWDEPAGRVAYAIVGFMLLLMAITNAYLIIAGSAAGAIQIIAAVGMLLFSGGLLASAIGGVRSEPGVAVGGGPLLLSYPLEPDECVVAHDQVQYASDDIFVQGSDSYWGRRFGECFITDRRIIVTPRRSAALLRRWKPFEIMLREVETAHATSGCGRLGSERRGVELKATRRRTFVFWSARDELLDALGQLGSPVLQA